ncbi:hypothetical protein VB618_10375 [Microvirga sp. CF3062]|uniref:hypothetical protein n=1 Tax=Microvirga sp. CF3062 TaxID=3110182 RepID=UPI002E787D54|nr:hypothetical protein [Microvirga sp. CF3062]MEE1656605.1 hypothetical protein [Microvirga sp. CF3062]
MNFYDWFVNKSQVDFGNLAVGLATAILAIVTLVVSLKNIKSNHSYKIADFRRHWIEELRVKVARFSVLYNELEMKVSGTFDRDGIKQKYWKVGNPEDEEKRKEMTEIVYHITLMLNPREKMHKDLVDMMNNYLALDVDANLREFHDLARQIMKAEWDRVKSH